jgi:hypothetical protein
MVTARRKALGDGGLSQLQQLVLRQAMVWKSTDMAGLWDEVTTINYKDPVAQWPSGVVSVV